MHLPKIPLLLCLGLVSCLQAQESPLFPGPPLGQTTQAAPPSPKIAESGAQEFLMFFGEDPLRAAATLAVLTLLLIVAQILISWIVSWFFAVDGSLANSARYIVSFYGVILVFGLVAGGLGLLFALVSSLVQPEQIPVATAVAVSVALPLIILFLLISAVGLPMWVYRMSFTEASGFFISLTLVTILLNWAIYLTTDSDNVPYNELLEIPEAISKQTTPQALFSSPELARDPRQWPEGKRVYLTANHTFNASDGQVKLRKNATLTIVGPAKSGYWSVRWKDTVFEISESKLSD